MTEELSERIRQEVARCRMLYGGVEEYDAYSMDKWINEVAALEQQIERSKEVINEYRGAGYHPKMERCPHGMSRWIGSHCKYDSRALTALDTEELK